MDSPAFICMHLDGARVAYTAQGSALFALAAGLDRAHVEAAFPDVQIIETRREPDAGDRIATARRAS